MILFTHEHVEMILAGQKTQTRRIWKKPRAVVGSVHQVKEKMFGPRLTEIYIHAVHKEHLLDITGEDAYHEGGYSREEFLKKWFEINPKSPSNPEIYAVTFELVQSMRVG